MEPELRLDARAEELTTTVWFAARPAARLEVMFEAKLDTRLWVDADSEVETVVGNVTCSGV